MNVDERGTSSTMISVSENEDNETLDTLSNETDKAFVNELTASIVLSSTSTSPSISSQLFVPEINILPPTTDDRLIFNEIDISARFHSFKQDVNSRIQQDIAITIEEHVQHLLALSSILLLKPARTHKDLHKHIDLNTCDALCQHIIQKHKMTNQSFPSEIKLQLEKIMIQLDVVNLREKPE